MQTMQIISLLAALLLTLVGLVSATPVEGVSGLAASHFDTSAYEFKSEPMLLKGNDTSVHVIYPTRPSRTMLKLET